MLWAFTKYHALGNDYIVIDPKNLPSPLTPAQVKTICHRNFGIGSDGILLGPLPAKKAKFALRIFNPDGSEAEKSGNGLRIFSRYLWDKKLVAQAIISPSKRPAAWCSRRSWTAAKPCASRWAGSVSGAMKFP